jgi:hypothetical protein
MNIATFQDDLLELHDFATRLEQFIDTEHEFVEGGLVIVRGQRGQFSKNQKTNNCLRVYRD